MSNSANIIKNSSKPITLKDVIKVLSSHSERMDVFIGKKNKFFDKFELVNFALDELLTELEAEEEKIKKRNEEYKKRVKVCGHKPYKFLVFFPHGEPSTLICNPCFYISELWFGYTKIINLKTKKEVKISSNESLAI